MAKKKLNRIIKKKKQGLNKTKTNRIQKKRYKKYKTDAYSQFTKSYEYECMSRLCTQGHFCALG